MHEYQGQQIVRRSWARRTGFTLAWLFLLAAAAAAVIATSEPVQAARDPPLAPRAEPHRPAARRGRAVHRQVPGTGGPAALGDRGRAVAGRPRHGDQAGPHSCPLAQRSG